MAAVGSLHFQKSRELALRDRGGQEEGGPPGGNQGLELVSEVKLLYPQTSVIAMTASSSVNAAVEAIIVGGMGARPLRGFADVGLTVYFADPGTMKSVGDVVDGFTANRLPVMHADQVCKGSGNCQH